MPACLPPMYWPNFRSAAIHTHQNPHWVIFQYRGHPITPSINGIEHCISLRQNDLPKGTSLHDPSRKEGNLRTVLSVFFRKEGPMSSFFRLLTVFLLFVSVALCQTQNKLRNSCSRALRRVCPVVQPFACTFKMATSVS